MGFGVCDVDSFNGSVSYYNKAALEDSLGGSLGRIATSSAGPTRGHMALSCATCAGVSWTTFLGLQFQMDCVGAVSFLS